MERKDLKPPPSLILPKYTRKEVREQRRFQKVLLGLVNQYITFKNTLPSPEALQKKYKELNRTWIGYALKWNADHSKTSVLRINDFSTFITDYEKNNKTHSEKG